MVAFFGDFRSSEVLSGSRSNSSGRALSLSDIAIMDGVLWIHLWRSKTDQHARGTDVILQSGPAGFPCPVWFMEKNLLAQQNGPGPLFIHKNGSCLSRF